jgi:hypothetical protein
VRYTVISVDDHVVEPAHLFETYLPPSLSRRPPDRRDRRRPRGVGVRRADFTQVGMNAVAGRRPTP